MIKDEKYKLWTKIIVFQSAVPDSAQLGLNTVRNSVECQLNNMIL